MYKSSYGLVLSGGGTKGAFEMGVWRALQELNIQTPCVIGTSVGAINAAIIAQNDFEKAYDFWYNLTINQVLNLSTSMADKYISRWEGGSFDLFRTSFLYDLFHGGLDIAPLRKSLAEVIDEDAVRRSPIRLGLVTVELDTLSPKQLMIEDIPEGMLFDYLLASAALPVFQRQEINGKTYLDGGFYDNVPINFMAEQGYQDILSVEFPAPGLKQKLSHQHVDITVIKNSEYLGMLLEFDQKTIRNNMQMGYLDTLKTLDAVSGHHFFIDASSGHHLYDRLNAFIHSPLPDAVARKRMACLLGLPEDASVDDLLAAARKTATQCGYPDSEPLSLCMLEAAGRSAGITRLEKYTPDALLAAILTRLSAMISDTQQLDFIRRPSTLKEAFQSFSESTTKFLDFVTAYLLFTGAKRSIPRALLDNLIRKCSKETILSIFILIYIHNMLDTEK